jgi:hypothetical protein
MISRLSLTGVAVLTTALATFADGSRSKVMPLGIHTIIGGGDC